MNEQGENIIALCQTTYKQGRKRPLYTSQKIIERREREGKREKGRRDIQRERKVEGEIQRGRER